MLAEQQIVIKDGASPGQEDELDEASILAGPTGAEILMVALLAEKTDTIFGYPGGAVLHIYDELWRFRDRITHYLVRHEQGAIHMADGYARASGRVGVALVTSGPGATFAITVIATSYNESMSLVIINGQVRSGLIAIDAAGSPQIS